MGKSFPRLFATVLALGTMSNGLAASERPAAGFNDADKKPALVSVLRSPTLPPVVFAHKRSDLLPDPDAHFGQLPNGMTYVLYKNRTPPGAAAIWFRVAAGSLMEQDDQRGLAHFVEHMAFNGSKNVAEGEMVKLLQRDGLAFGADTNAHTNTHETLYTLNLPEANDRIVGDALFLMRETAGNIGFDPAAINRERGVVLSEERARGGAALDAYEAQIKLMYSGQKYSERLPIGKVGILKNAQRPAFARFYNDFYRPEYSTLIVVGDIDIAKVEDTIRHRFSDWRPGPQSIAGRIDFGTLVAPVRPAAKTFVGAGLPDALSISWVTPPRDDVQTKAKDYDDLLGVFAKNILNERLERAAGETDAAFVSAGVQSENIGYTARVFSLSIRPKKGLDRQALAQAVDALRAFAKTGPTKGELDRALRHYDSYFEGRVAAARTIPTQAIAERIANSVRSQGVFQSPAQELEEFEELKPQFTVAALVSAVQKFGLDAPPYLWRQGERATAFDEAAMLAAYEAAVAAPVRSAKAHSLSAWPYEKFGTASPVVSRHRLANVDATRVSFGNGTVLTVKQTNFADDAIVISVNFGDGLGGVARRDAAILFAARQVGLVPGGLGKLSADDLSEVLAGTNYSLNFSIDDSSSTLGGSTTKTDFARQMQVLAAFVTDPGFRPQPLERFKETLEGMYADLETSPLGTYSLRARAAVYGDDPRFATPAKQDLLSVTNKQIEALIRRQFDGGPVEITIVGDISLDAAIEEVGKTFGALPPRQALISGPVEQQVSFPSKNLHRVFAHRGRADQNVSMIAWPTTDYLSDTRRAAGLLLLAAIVSGRQLDEVREKQGASYSASAGTVASIAFPGFGYLESQSLVRPEIDEAYYRTMSAIVGDLRKKPVSGDELARARQPWLDGLRNQQNNNFYWLAALSGSLREPRQIAASLSRESDLLAVTTNDIQRLAQEYLVMEKALRIQVKAAP